MVTVSFLWALCYPLIETAGQAVPFLHLAAARAAIAGATLLACAAVLGQSRISGLGVWTTLSGIGLFSTSLGFFGMFRAGEFVSPGIATIVNDAQPLLASLIAWWVLRERPSVLGWGGLLLGLGGIVIIASPNLVGANATAASVGYGFALLGGGGVALGNVLMKRLPSTLDPMAAMGWQLVLGCIPLALAAAALEPMPNLAAIQDLAGTVLLLAIVGTAIPFAIWFSVLRSTPLVKANAYTFLTAVFGLAIGAAFFRERLTWLEVVGVGVTLLGVHLAQRGASCRASVSAA
jgi:drug/metabolite transporter (DMT)-like permease